MKITTELLVSILISLATTTCAQGEKMMAFNPLRETLPIRKTDSITRLGLKDCQRPKFSSDNRFLAAFNRGYLTVWRVAKEELIPVWSFNSGFPKSICTDFAWTNEGLAFGKVNFPERSDAIPDSDIASIDTRKGETLLLHISNLKVTPLLSNAYIQYLSDNSGALLCCGSPTGSRSKDLVLDFYSLSLGSEVKRVGRYSRKEAGLIKLDKQFISIWKANQGVLVCLGADSNNLVQYAFISKNGSATGFLPKNAGAFPFFKAGDPLPVFDYDGDLHILLSYFGKTPVISAFKNWALLQPKLEVSLKAQFPELLPEPRLFTFSPNGRFYLVGNSNDEGDPNSTDLVNLWAVDTALTRRKLLCRLSSAAPLAWTSNGLLIQGFDEEAASSQYNLISFPEGYLKNKLDLEQALKGPGWEDVPSDPK